MDRIECPNEDCVYYGLDKFKDKCKDCTENRNADSETAVFHYEDELYD